MEISNNDLKNTMNLSQSLNLRKQEIVTKKEDTLAFTQNLPQSNQEQITLGRTAQKLEELNKQKVTPDSLESAVAELKDDKEISSESNAETTQATPPKKSKNTIIDPRDKNRDGKVSNAEKLEAQLKKEQSENSKTSKSEKVLGLIKDVIGELKKDKGFSDINPEQFKGISKMVNSDLIDSKDSVKINKFLEN